MILIIAAVVALVTLLILVKFLRFLFSAGRGPAAHRQTAPPAFRSNLQPDAGAAARAQSARAAEDQRRRDAHRRNADAWARSPINPMNINSPMHPANPMNPNNPMNPINRNRNRR